MIDTTPRTHRLRRRFVALVLAGVGAAAGTLLSTAHTAAAADQDLATVVVTVLDPSGHRAPDMVVSAGGYVAGRTGDDGVLTAVVFAGETTVCANLPYGSSRGGPTGWGQACTAVTLVRASTTAVRVRMQLAAAFGGTVRDARTGNPVAGTRLLLILTDGSMPQTFTGAQGRYRYRDQDAGTRSLETVDVTGPISAAGAPWGYVGLHPAGPGTLTLTPGVRTTGVDFTLVPNVRLAGTVTGPGGGVVAGADIAIRLDADHVVRVRTNARGDYLVIVPWNSAGPVCASVAPGTAFPGGLARQCRTGLFERGVEVHADFTLTAGG